MTRLERYAQMMKVSLGKVEARVAYHVSAEGSVLAQTVQARADRIEIHYHIESADGCYVRQTVNRPGFSTIPSLSTTGPQTSTTTRRPPGLSRAARRYVVWATAPKR